MENPILHKLNKTDESEVGFSSFRPCSIDDFVDIGLHKFEVFPGVFNPATSFSGKFLAQVLFNNKHLFVEADVLDMACGSGILGIVCAISGAKSVICTDISHSASTNALHNAKLLGLTIKAFHGNLFEALDRSLKFDCIVFNPPGFEGTPNSEIDSHYFCPYDVIDNFYALAPNFLRKNGFIVSATSEIHDISRSPLTIAKKYGYLHDLIAVADSDWGKQYAYQVQPN